MTEHISSYRDLPKAVYQFQNKFRNEARAKSGIMRSREFMMKDLYSFSRSEEEHQAFYERVKDAYHKICGRLGIGDRTYATFASGGIFSTKFSEEFQTLSEAGEDIIYLNEQTKVAFNKEVFTDENLEKMSLTREDFVEKKAIETGNIFHLGTRFSEPLGLMFKEEGGNNKPVIMGSYGFGPTRTMGTLVEVLSDEKGIVWPKEVAPFQVHLIELSGGNSDVHEEAEDLYRELVARGIEVLWDDRDARAGEKFADADLIGIPLRVIVSEKTVAEGTHECTHRRDGKVEHLSTSELVELLTPHA